MKSFTVLFLFAIFLCQVYCIKFYAPEKQVKVIEGTNATIRWTYSAHAKESLSYTLHFFALNLGIVDLKTHILKTIHVNRYTVTINNNSVLLTIRNLRYNDAGRYHGTISSETKDILDHEIHIPAVDLITIGPPTVCGNPLLPSYHFVEASSPTINNITICSYPKPRVIVTLNNKALQYIVQPINDYKRLIVLQLPTLSASSCGHLLKFKALNNYGWISTETVINITFALPAVQHVELKVKDGCQIFRWDVYNTGVCKVYYEIQIFGEQKDSIGLIKTPPFTRTFMFCYAQNKLPPIDTARVRLKYLSQVGNWSSNFSRITFPYSTNNKKNGDNKVALTAGTVGGFILVIICVLLIVYLRRKAKGERSAEMEIEMDDTDVALLRMKAEHEKSSVYTDINDEYLHQTYTGLINCDPENYENIAEFTKAASSNNYEVPYIPT